jgi:hypothetical protein
MKKAFRWISGASLAVALAAGGAFGAASDAAIVEQNGEWLNNYGVVYYRVSGKVENKSAKPLKWVKVRLDLLDADGKSVWSMEGYNQKAEAMGGADDGTGMSEPNAEAMKAIEPIAPGEKDNFRLGAAKGEMPKKPKWKTWKVTLLDAQ